MFSVSDNQVSIENLKRELTEAKRAQEAWTRVSNRMFKETKEPGTILRIG